MKHRNFYRKKIAKKKGKELFQIAVFILALFMSPCASGQMDTIIFNYSGGLQTWTVPVDITEVTVQAAGAQGGPGPDQEGGLGFRVRGDLTVTPGDILNIYVGGQGALMANGNVGGGGWNGGGDSRGGSGTFARGGGGGASDVRVGGTSLNHRVIVAAGGGGSALIPYKGGNGGGDIGSNGVGGSAAGKGGTQNNGGNGSESGCGVGTLGVGGSSSDNSTCAGGGGGYYGGGSGSGAGGGSSYIGGVDNGEHLIGLRNGNGLVMIIYNSGIENDHCENPLPIGCNETVFGNTENSTPDNPPCRGISGTGGGLWYSFVGTGEDILVSTCHPGTDYDTYLSIYTSDCDEPICVASNDDSATCSASGKSEVSFFAAMGGTYKILVDGLNGAEGNFQLSITCGDPCENAIPIICTEVVSGNTVNAPLANGPACGAAPNGKGIWYKFEGNGYCIDLTTCWEDNGIPTEFDTQISVYEGSCSSLSCIAYNDDAEYCNANGSHPGSSNLSFSSVQGLDYYILVHGKNNEAGTFFMRLNCQNDDIFQLECPNFGTVACGDPWPPVIDNLQEFQAQGGYITTDVCGGGPYTFDAIDVPYGDCSADGELRFVRTYYITDESTGITKTCDQNFYCGPLELPSITCPPNETLACGIGPLDPATTVEEFEAIGGTVSGGCQPLTISSTEQEFDCDATGDVSFIRQYVVTDANGNTQVCNQEFYCEAIPELALTCPPDLQLGCYEDVPPAITEVQDYFYSEGSIDGGACPGWDYNASLELTVNELEEGDLCDGLTIIREYTVRSIHTDEVQTCEQYITIPAYETPILTPSPPVAIECVEDMASLNVEDFINVYYTGGSCPNEVTAVSTIISPNTVSNCSNDTIFTLSRFQFECGEDKLVVQKFFVQNEGVQVTIAPDEIIECLDDITVSSADITISEPCPTFFPTFPRIVGPFSTTPYSNCNGAVHTVFYIFEDSCGEEHQYTRDFTIQNEGTQVEVAPDMEVTCVDDIEVSEDDVLISSPCGISLEAEYDGPMVSDPSRPNCTGTTHTYRYYFTDECEEFHEYFRVFTIQNKALELIPVDPNLDGINNGDVVSIQCQSNTPGWSLPQFDADAFEFETACDLEADIVFTFEDLGATNCETEGYAHAYAYTWTVSDDCGSSETFSFELRVVDEIDPILSGVPGDVTLECSEELPLPPTVTATDECECADVFYKEEELNSDECSGNRIIVRTWTAKDCCGNEVSQSQRITIEDHTSPVVSYEGLYENDILSAGGVTLECSNEGHESWLFGLDENSIVVSEMCSENVHINYTLHGYTPPSCAVAGYKDEWKPTWTVVDDCGNETRYSFIVRMEDNTSPYLLKSDVLYLCENDQEGYAWVEDDCSNALWTTNDEIVPGCAEGIYYRTYEMEDECGNTSSDQQLVIDLSARPNLIELIEPVELPLVVQCGTEDEKVKAFSPASVLPMVDCIPDLEINYFERRNTQPCIDGTTLIEYIWTASTPCGYVDSLIIKAKLIDEVPPVFENMADTVYISCIDEMPKIHATDECSDVEMHVQANLSDWGCMSEGAVERIITATDACGNISQTTQMVYLMDEEGPEFNDEAIICYSENTEELSAIDACNGDEVEAKLVDSERTLCGNYDIIINTYSATDECGNTTEFIQKVYPDEFEIEILVLDENLKDLDPRNVIQVDESDFANFTFIYGLNGQSVVAETPCQEILHGAFESTVRFTEDCEDGVNRIYNLKWTFKTGCAQEDTYEVEIHVMNDEALVLELEDLDPIYCSEVIPELVILNEVEEFDYAVTVDDRRDAKGDGQVIRTVTVVDNCDRESSATQVIEFFNTSDLVCEIDGDFAPGCNTADNYYTVIVSGGTAPYQIEWMANGGNCSIEWAEGETANINIGFGQANIQVRVTDANGCETTCDARISCVGMLNANVDQYQTLESSNVQEEEISTSIEELHEKITDVNVYPNPFWNDLKIDIPNDLKVQQIEVIDVRRRVLVRKKVEEVEKEITLNLNELDSGVYFLLISTKDDLITRKVVRL